MYIFFIILFCKGGKRIIIFGMPKHTKNYKMFYSKVRVYQSTTLNSATQQQSSQKSIKMEKKN